MSRIYPPEFRERALRMLSEARPDHESEYAAMSHVASFTDLMLRTVAALVKRGHECIQFERLSQRKRQTESGKRRSGERALHQGLDGSNDRWTLNVERPLACRVWS